MRARKLYYTMASEDGATCDVLKQSWYQRLGSPSKILAPMVDQSECAFRMLCRKHGCDLAYSPMYSSKQFTESELYRNSMINSFDGCETLGDRPLVIQFAGNDPQILLEAAKHVQHRCNAVDLNLGCPQKRAQEGHYGSYLLDKRDWELVESIVSAMAARVEVPYMCPSVRPYMCLRWLRAFRCLIYVS